MLIQTIFQAAQQTPQRAAFVHDGVACSWAGFAAHVAALYETLAALALPAGRVAVVDVDDIAQAWLVGLALRHLGLTTVSLGGPVSAERLRHLGLDDIGCVVTLAHGADEAVAEPRWRTVNVAPCSLAHAPGPLPACPPARHAAGGHILLTSGTTGAHKKVLRDPAAEDSTLALHAQINEIDADSVVYVRDFPPWTAGGYRWPLVAWSQRATVVFQQGRDLDAGYRRPGLTHAFATPATLQFLLAPGAQQAPRTDGMRLFVTGGAMSRALAQAARQQLTPRVYSVLASTEALTLAVTPLEQLDDLPWHRIHPLREVQVVDEAGRELPPGQLGLVRARVLDGLAGYLGDERASRAFFRDGWFYSGDLGTRRADGRLALGGRVTDVLNLRGSKLPSGPLERTLQERLAVDAVCLLSLPGPEGPDELHVVIESARSFARDELAALAQGPLRDFDRVHFHVVAALPRNTMGKVQRLALRQRFTRSG